MQQLTEEQRKELEEKLKNMPPEELKEFQKQQCIFCQIIAGKVPAKKIYEDDSCIAILDINPAARGHILLLPKEHYSIMPQVAPKEMSRMFVIAKQLSKVLLKSLKADGTNIFIANGLAAGQRAQHFMLHVIPRKTGDNIFELQEKLVNEEMVNKVKLAIEQKLNQLLGIKKEIVDVKKVVGSVEEPKKVIEKIEVEKEAEEKESDENGLEEESGEEDNNQNNNREDQNNEDKNYEDKSDEDQNVRDENTEDQNTEDISVSEITKDKSESKPAKKVTKSKTKSKKGNSNKKSDVKQKSKRKNHQEEIHKSKDSKKKENDGKASLDDIANLFR